MDVIKLSLDRLIEETNTCRCNRRYSSSIFTRKVPKWGMPCDYDEVEKLIEFEFPDGYRTWLGITWLFGKVISEAKEILLQHPEGQTESMSIAGIEVVKIKRSLYCKLIFECDLPF